LSKAAESAIVYRILDANLNRLREGLRTVEDYLRFVCNNTAQTRRLKAIRHALFAVQKKLGPRKLLQARESGADVGKKTTRKEANRKSLVSVAAANLKRCEEAARVLEEYCKLIDAAAAEQCKCIRFELYEFEKIFILQ
jgi:thiamine-phosphate pyrophosphorylase